MRIVNIQQITQDEQTNKKQKKNKKRRSCRQQAMGINLFSSSRVLPTWQSRVRANTKKLRSKIAPWIFALFVVVAATAA